jgi:Zn-dependent peptidase ImmA (M78 family)
MMSRREIGQLARLRAKKILKDLRIESRDEIDVEAIAAYYGVFAMAGGIQGADGRLIRYGDRGIVRIRNDIVQVGRRRYVLAHELGHFFLHVAGSVSLCNEGDLSSYGQGSQESEANWFAAELLMPEQLFSPNCDVAEPSMDVVRRLAEKFEVTLTAACIRFVDCAPERCAVVWSEAGKVKWGISGPEFPGYIERGMSLSKFSNAYDAFAPGRTMCQKLEPVPAHAWLSDIRFRQSSIHEHSLRFSGLGAALTLLWMPESEMPEFDSDDD